MAFQNILFEVKDGIALVTINRPEVLNALNRQTLRELSEAIAQVEGSESIKGAIITGSGERSFAAGADIRELAELTPLEAHEFALNGQALLDRIESLSKPVVAAVNGYALGGGCEIAMACHMRIASENAEFGQPEINLGIIPGYGGTQRLPRLVGRGIATELILTGRRISAQEAYRIGLVNQVVPLADLIPSAEKLLQTIFSKGPIAVAYALQAIHRGLQMGLEQGLKMEADLFGLIFATEDVREGTRAFLEKRKPEFKGR